MPKVNANLADINTEYVPAAPDDYELLIEEIKLESAGGRDTYKITVSIDQPGHEEHGKRIFHSISMHKKDGTDNPAGLADLKRYFEAVFGKQHIKDEGENFDYDTDYLLKQRVGGSVVIESYEYEKNGAEKKGQSNKITKLWQL